MKRLIAITLSTCCAIAAPPRANSEQLHTVQDLLNTCEYSSRGGEEDAFARGLNFGLCNGYVHGIFMMLMPEVAPKLPMCAPENVTHGQETAVFKAWAQRNPQKWNESALMGVIRAFQEVWPCDTSKP
jgi:hypothetical protein